MFKVTADPLRFDEAVNWFRGRLPITDDQFANLAVDTRQRAWTIAGVAQQDVINTVFQAIDKANDTGESFEEFKKSVSSLLTEQWGKPNAARVETIFRNATQSSLNRGRYAQMKEPDVVRFRPFWMYDSVRDSRTTDLCKGLDQTILPQDHQFWDTHIPPLHHRCRAGIRNLRRAEAERRGIRRDPPNIDAEPGFGRAPGKGDWEPNQAKYPQEIRRASKKRKKRTEKPAGPLQEGVHFKAFRSEGLTASEQTRVLEAARKAHLVEFLERKPLSELFIAPRVSAGRDSNGAYWPALERIGVRATRGADTFAHPWVPGQSWSVSYSGKNKVDAMRRTFVHELGHHVHLTAGTEGDLIVQKAFFDREPNPITRYGGNNRKEYFAESFAAYVFHRGDLRKNDPTGYKMVRAVLTLQGIPL